MTKFICVSGEAQHGKDTSAEFIRAELETLGEDAIVIHYADLLKFICKTYFGWNGQKDEAGRTLLQYVGTDVVRKQRPDYWVDFVIDVVKLFPDEWSTVIIPDCRFPNEIEALKNAGYDVTHVRVYRPNFDNGLTAEQKNHPSETALREYPYDILLTNDGTMNGLKESIDRWLYDN